MLGYPLYFKYVLQHSAIKHGLSCFILPVENLFIFMYAFVDANYTNGIKIMSRDSLTKGLLIYCNVQTF